MSYPSKTFRLSSLEAGDSTVGKSISRTVHYKRVIWLDIGGHRFFTKWDEVNEIWCEVLGDKFLRRKRLSRIFYREAIFLLSVTAQANVLFKKGLGVCRECIRIAVLSYLEVVVVFLPQRAEPGAVGNEPVRQASL